MGDTASAVGRSTNTQRRGWLTRTLAAFCLASTAVTVVGGDYSQRLVDCLFGGPALPVVADVGARLTLGGAQIPTGFVPGVLGGPYARYSMRKRQSRGEI